MFPSRWKLATYAIVILMDIPSTAPKALPCHGREPQLVQAMETHAGTIRSRASQERRFREPGHDACGIVERTDAGAGRH